jgi:hypothetical protein
MPGGVPKDVGIPCSLHACPAKSYSVIPDVLDACPATSPRTSDPQGRRNSRRPGLMPGEAPKDVGIPGVLARRIPGYVPKDPRTSEFPMSSTHARRHTQARRNSRRPRRYKATSPRASALMTSLTNAPRRPQGRRSSRDWKPTNWGWARRGLTGQPGWAGYSRTGRATGQEAMRDAPLRKPLSSN